MLEGCPQREYLGDRVLERLHGQAAVAIAGCEAGEGFLGLAHRVGRQDQLHARLGRLQGAVLWRPVPRERAGTDCIGDGHSLEAQTGPELALHDGGRTPEAIALDEKTLLLRESTLGPDHPDTLNSRNNLAQAYLAAGRTAEAAMMHEKTLALMEMKFGPEDRRALVSR